MKFSESIKNINAAVVAFQEEMKNTPVTADNPFYKSKYTPLDDIIEQAKPLLAKNGLAVLQSPCSEDGRTGVVTTLLHDSGEYIQGLPFYLKPTKDDPQMAGSAITYARRYSLAAMLNVASDPDDDGNKSSGKTEDTKSKTIPLSSMSGETPVVYTCENCQVRVPYKVMERSKEVNNGRIFCSAECVLEATVGA